jgi:DnaJ-domain-containing protein 1
MSHNSQSLLPLSGAHVYIASDNTTRHSELSAFVVALGGSIASTLREAKDHCQITHVLWAYTNPTAQAQAQSPPAELASDLKAILIECQRRNIPVVESSWLERISGLSEGEHWSQVNVGSHVPAIVAMVDMNVYEDNNNILEEGGRMQVEEEAKDTVIGEPVLGFHYKWRRDEASRLGRSISETFSFLTQEQPDQMEDHAIQRALELSMLDCALVYRQPDASSQTKIMSSSKASLSSSRKEQKPHEILGIAEHATPAQIKAAYRKLALKTHPDKGGSADVFEVIARAYRSLLSSEKEQPIRNTNLKGTAHWDSELQDHRRLVANLFQAHGTSMDSFIAKQLEVLETLGLTAKDAGATNRNEKDELIHNSCFYLSLAASYLRGIGALMTDDTDDPNHTWNTSDDDADQALIGETALQLKRSIEAAVVKCHPEWAAQGKVGEEVQAFSDFLVYTLDSPTLLSDWVVVVFDTTSGFCDVYKGQQYAKMACRDELWAQSNTLTLRYTPGHYQPLVGSDSNAPRPSLEQILKALDDAGVYYVVTDGAA